MPRRSRPEMTVGSLYRNEDPEIGFRKDPKIRKSKIENGGQIPKEFARGAKVEEPLCWVETYPAQWREPLFDLAGLARLRWIEGLSYKEIGARLGKTQNAIEIHCRVIRQRGFDVGLEKGEIAKVRSKALQQN